MKNIIKDYPSIMILVYQCYMYISCMVTFLWCFNTCKRIRYLVFFNKPSKCKVKVEFFTLQNGLRSGVRLLYHCLFKCFWEHVCATISYIKFSKAIIKGLECMPHITASSSITSTACIGSSSYIRSSMLIQRSSNNLK